MAQHPENTGPTCRSALSLTFWSRTDQRLPHHRIAVDRFTFPS